MRLLTDSLVRSVALVAVWSGAGGTRTPDQRISDAYVWAGLVFSYLLVVSHGDWSSNDSGLNRAIPVDSGSLASNTRRLTYASLGKMYDPVAMPDQFGDTQVSRGDNLGSASELGASEESRLQAARRFTIWFDGVALIRSPFSVQQRKLRAIHRREHHRPRRFQTGLT
jgi:hypothetical protein